MITLSEKEYRVLLAQCAAALLDPHNGARDAITRAESIIDQCGIKMDNPVAHKGTGGVEPPRCPVCKDYVWPTQSSTTSPGIVGLVHEQCAKSSTKRRNETLT